MSIFRGFFRSKERFIIYRKLPYFECQFGGFLGEELGGKGIPQIVCESLPHSFGKRGDVCLLFLDIDLHGFSQNGVRNALNGS
jgi:hypothetical protein